MRKRNRVVRYRGAPRVNLTMRSLAALLSLALLWPAAGRADPLCDAVLKAIPLTGEAYVSLRTSTQPAGRSDIFPAATVSGARHCTVKQGARPAYVCAVMPLRTSATDARKAYVRLVAMMQTCLGAVPAAAEIGSVNSAFASTSWTPDTDTRVVVEMTTGPGPKIPGVEAVEFNDVAIRVEVRQSR